MSNQPQNTFQDGHPQLDDLHAYLDQELDKLAIDELENHLASCSTCQKQVDRLKTLTLRINSLPEIQMDKDFSTTIKNRIRDKQQVPRGITWTLLVEGVAAGVVLGLIIPAIQVSIWPPRLMKIQHELQAAINIFMTQIASNWIYWWTKTQFDFTQVFESLNPSIILPQGFPSPWILILVGVGAGLLTNFILLRSSFQFRNNGTNS